MDLVNLHRISNDAWDPLQCMTCILDESHELLILNGFPCFLDSSRVSCYPNSGWPSVVDCVLTNRDLLPYICQFFITLIPLAYRALLSISLKANHPPLLTLQAPLVLLSRLMMGIWMPFLPTSSRFFSSPNFLLLVLGVWRTSSKYDHLSFAIWEAIHNSYPHTTRSPSCPLSFGSSLMNKWYDDDCKAHHI
jgi:hypothetical protein